MVMVLLQWASSEIFQFGFKSRARKIVLNFTIYSSVELLQYKKIEKVTLAY